MSTFRSNDHPRGPRGRFAAKAFNDSDVALAAPPAREPLAPGDPVRLINAISTGPVTGTLIGTGQTNTFGTWTLDIDGRRFRDIGHLEEDIDDVPATIPMNPVRVPLWRALFPRRHP